MISKKVRKNKNNYHILTLVVDTSTFVDHNEHNKKTIG